MNLGVRAHDFGKLPVDELARQIAHHGLSCVQLAPTKAIAGCDNDAGGFAPEFATNVRDAFHRHGIQIAVLGCYINLGDPDEARCRPQLERFKAHLRAARDFGCSIVGTETGSLHPDFSWHPDNHGEMAFQVVLSHVRELVHEAEKCGVSVGIEAVERYVISSPRRLKRLIDEIASPHLRVIFDPVNLLCGANQASQDELMGEMTALLADRISIVHAKDFTLTSGRFDECPAGQGELHYPRLMTWIRQNKPGIHVLLENTAPSTIAQTASFMRSGYRAA